MIIRIRLRYDMIYILTNNAYLASVNRTTPQFFYTTSCAHLMMINRSVTNPNPGRRLTCVVYNGDYHTLVGRRITWIVIKQRNKQIIRFIVSSSAGTLKTVWIQHPVSKNLVHLNHVITRLRSVTLSIASSRSGNR